MKNKLPLGLYVHIPFCRSKCIYCDFYSLPNAEDRMDAYCEALEAHLTETAQYAKSHCVDTIYFGGGTPTLLGEKRLAKLLGRIQKKYDVAHGAEITFEANPESAQDWKALRSLRRAGFNRISLGMQSSSDELLRTLGRIHTFAQVKSAVEAARKAKIADVSVDLIYGLPGQDMAQWKRDLEEAVNLGVEHISCYGLKVEEGTPLCRDIAHYELPDDDAQADFYLYAVAFLASKGYEQYEISNFARSGHLSRHNYKYWTLGEYAGFGPGAHSDFGDVRYAYVRDVDAYIRGIKSGSPLLSESERIPARQRDTEYIMLGLRTAEGIAPREFEQRFRLHFDALAPLLEKYAEVGYAACENERWHLTPKGFLVSNQIIGALLEVLSEDKKRRADAAARGDFRVV